MEIAQATGELDALQRQLESFKRQADIESEQATIRKKSFEMGYTSRLAYLETKSKFEAAMARISDVAGQIFKVGKKADEAAARLNQAVAERLQKFADERSKVAGELAEVTQTLANSRTAYTVLSSRLRWTRHQSPGAEIRRHSAEAGDLVAGSFLWTAVSLRGSLKAKDLGMSSW